VRHIAALPSIAIILGSALGLLASEPPTLPASIALTACTVSIFWARRAGEDRALVACVAGAFLSGAVLLAADAWQRAWHPPLRALFERAAQAERTQAAAEGRTLPMEDEASLIVEGTLRQDASPSENGVSISVDVDRAGVQQADEARGARGGVALTVVGEMATERMDQWRAGRRVRLRAQLRRPSRYLDPGVPDYERALARRGTTLVGTVKSGALVEVTARGSWWTERLAAARAFSRRAIDQYVGRWSTPSAAIVAAIVIGDRSALDADVQRRLQEAGTYHVIAISGGNIAILAGVLLGVFRLAGILGRGAMAAAIVLLAAYAQFVGGGASVDRATMMASLYFVARALDQRTPPLNTIAVVAAVLVVSNPLSVADPAFLLTFGATLAIVFAARRNDFARWPRPAAAVAAMFVASAAAEVLLLPIGAALFQRVTFAGLALNFLAIPLMGVAQIAGMAVVPASVALDPLARSLGWVAHAGATGLVWSADLVRFAPAVTWRVAAPAAGACAMYYLALTAAWFRPSVRPIATAVAVASGIWIIWDPAAFAARHGDGRLHITFLDVGQGDAILVVFPKGSSLLVDAGGLGNASSFDVGERVVAPVLRAARVRRLDRIALTHGDVDHIGGALSVIREFRPPEVLEGIPVPRSEVLLQLRTATAEAGGAWANVYARHRLVVDDVEMTAWSPAPEEWERQKVRNDDSLVLELRWRAVSVVLTGDIGTDIERALVPLIPPAAIRVVKVPHHGSLTSSAAEFVAALRPRVAVASAGRNNHFGHPVPEVLRRYEAAGAAVFRTDRDGAVFVDTDGRALEVRTFTGRTESIAAR
jgi:competence protein ComEC